MSIEVKREPGEYTLLGLERCAFCWLRTPFWYVFADVAVCEACAAKVDCHEVPTKIDWWNQTTGVHHGV